MPVQQVSLFGEGDENRYPHDGEEEKEHKEAFHAGTHPHAHQTLDSKDQRSIKNKLAAYEHDEHHPEQRETSGPEEHHQHETGVHIKTHEKRGAKIDEELEKEDEETVKAMDDHKHNQHHKHEHGKHHH